ncbi:hypothetical protein Pan216_08170 [Planctomycetes bacterium Pan216]|uniref:Lipoprotein n=1 Tax=Kolteria novifilia TaxID=2527975 RepID=A0A518AZ51_9BACT|nr:hypothetical protein Pan216_08170 [Planctomycetes bacterium Pan216]
MRAVGGFLLIGAVALGAGCSAMPKALESLVIKGEHFRFPTSAQEQSDKSMERSVEVVKGIMKQRDISIGITEIGENKAQIRGSKEGLQYVFDVERNGEGSVVKLEIDECGNDSIAWGIMRDYMAYP